MVEDDETRSSGGGGFGPLGTVANMAQAGLSTATDLLQIPRRQVQEWLGDADGPLQGLMSQITEQVGRVQRELLQRLEALDRGRHSLEQLITSQIDSLCKEQRATRTQVQRIAVQVEEPSGSAARSRAKKSTAKKSTGKKSTAKKSTAKKSTAKRSSRPSGSSPSARDRRGATRGT
jgi:hypothetical protein